MVKDIVSVKKIPVQSHRNPTQNNLSKKKTQGGTVTKVREESKDV